MTTYWLLGEKRVDRNNQQNGNDDGAGPSTSFAGDNINVNPSITFQGPDSPAGHSLAQNGHPHDLNNQQGDDDLQSQGACALPSNRTQRANATNEFVYQQDVEMNKIYYQDNPVHVTTTKLSVELQNERTRIQREMNICISDNLVSSSNDVEDKSKDEDEQNSLPRDLTLESSLERGHGGQRQNNGNEYSDIPLYAVTPTSVICKGMVRATVLMFNRRWKNDDDSKKPN